MQLLTRVCRTVVRQAMIVLLGLAGIDDRSAQASLARRFRTFHGADASFRTPR